MHAHTHTDIYIYLMSYVNFSICMICKVCLVRNVCLLSITISYWSSWVLDIVKMLQLILHINNIRSQWHLAWNKFKLPSCIKPVFVIHYLQVNFALKSKGQSIFYFCCTLTMVLCLAFCFCFPSLHLILYLNLFILELEDIIIFVNFYHVNRILQ